MSWIYYSLVLVAYYVLHSIMASFMMKDLFRNLGVNDQIYRILFNIIALGSTIIVLKLYGDTENTLGHSGYVWGYLVCIAGFGIIAIALLNYDLLTFVGLKKESPSSKLVTKGLNKYIRHPLYLGIITGMVGWVIVLPDDAAIATLIVSFLYIQIGIFLEEKKLVNQFGKAYQYYQSEVPKLFPKLNFR